MEITLQAIRARHNGLDIHLYNAYSVALVQRDFEFAKCASQATLNFPDGKPISWFSTMYGTKLHQVRGPSFFESVFASGRKVGTKHFLLGSTSETLEMLQQKLEEKYPGIQIVGTLSPEFRMLTDIEYEAQDDFIASCQPDIVWVGLGTPKQDFEAQRLASKGFAAAAVGAAFDFSAGTKSIAPRWMRMLGLEWFHRLASEPRRLWKRYLWGNSIFLVTVVKHSMKLIRYSKR